MVARPPCGAQRWPTATGRALRAGRAHELRARLRPRRLHRRAGRRAAAAGTSTWWPWPASARSSARPMFEAFPGRILNTHPALLPVLPRLARGRRRARLRREGHRAAPCTSPPRRSTPARSWPRRRSPVEPDDTVETLHERIKARRAPPLRPHHLRDPRKGERPVRALLSVYDKSGVVELARRAARAGLGPGLQRRHRPGHRRGRRARHRRGRPHRLPRHPRAPGGHPAPQGARRHPRRPDRPRARGRHGEPTASSPSTWSWPTSIPFSAEPSIELIDIGGPAMVRAAGQEPRPRRHRHRPRPLRRGARRAPRATARCRPTTRRRLARDAFAHTAAYDAEILAWFDAGHAGAG